MSKNRFVISLLLLTMIVSSACFSSYPSYEEVIKERSKIKSIPFEKAKWFNEKGVGREALWEDRPGLARDLINQNLLIGKSLPEVKELLGDNEIDKHTNSISYDTFVEMGVVDPVFIESVVIQLNEDEKVNKAEIKIVMMDGHPDYR